MVDSINPCPSERRYRLVDFGEGRKLESFGGRLLDRPCPAANGIRKRRPDRWDRVDSVYDVDRRTWKHQTPWPEACQVDCGGFRMPISPTPFGHVGLFPEQMTNWHWLGQTSPKAACDSDSASPAGMAGLNLFAYTGASSIAMARQGIRVAHVDAAKQNVAAAREAAELNGLGDHPIRYLVDDAAKFVAREGRRGHRYHTIVMDPPAYGHSPSGKAWRLERDLWPLIDDCLAVLSPDRFRLLITGHSPQVGAPDVLDYLRVRLAERIDSRAVDFDACCRSGRLSLKDSSDRRLDAGFFVQCSYPARDA